MVRDVGEDVGRLAVRLHEDAVLVVTEVGGAEPDRAVGFVGDAVGAQVVERGLDGARLDHRPLAEPRVEPHPHALEGLPHVSLDPLVTPLQWVRVVGELRRPLGDVVTLIAAVGRLVAPLASRERVGEQLHLHAAVVQVELTVGHVAAPLEHVAQRVAVRGPAAAPGVHGAGRVGRDELDVDARAFADVVAGEAVDAGVDDVAQHVVQPGVM